MQLACPWWNWSRRIADNSAWKKGFRKDSESICRTIFRPGNSWHKRRNVRHRRYPPIRRIAKGLNSSDRCNNLLALMYLSHRDSGDSPGLNPGVEAITELLDACNFQFPSSQQPSRHFVYLHGMGYRYAMVESAIATRSMAVDGQRYARFAKIPYGPANFAPGDFLSRAFSELFPASLKRRRDHMGGVVGSESLRIQQFCQLVFQFGSLTPTSNNFHDHAGTASEVCQIER